MKQGWQGLTQTQDEVFRLKDPLPTYIFLKEYLGSNDVATFTQDFGMEWRKNQTEKLKLW